MDKALTEALIASQTSKILSNIICCFKIDSERLVSNKKALNILNINELLK